MTPAEKMASPDLATRVEGRLDAIEGNLNEIGRLNSMTESALKLAGFMRKGAFVLRWQFRRDARKYNRAALRLLEENNVLALANAVDLAGRQR